MTDTDLLFQPGTTVVRRAVHGGRVWAAMPQRVVADTVRKQSLEDLAAGTWTLCRYRWTGTALLSHFLAGEWFSVHCFQDAATGDPLRWYVNFEKPFVRTATGIDTLDLCRPPPRPVRPSPEGP